MKRKKLTIKVMNPLTEDKKEKLIKKLTRAIQERYYS